ncbi:VTT domain-containing protein [Patescibacteria group bacterium]|nr:VTT domain-containing protein [Patescibacteria group bacterium]MCL5091345.1 VTT domain-containing protein [Patescibacteria group bacterium]
MKKTEKVTAILTLILFIPLIYLLVKNIHDVDNVVQRAGLAAPLVLVFFYGLFALTPVSTDPLTIISGVMFGPWFGIIISWVGNMTAATVEYYFGSHISRITKRRLTKNILPFGLHRLPVNSPWFLILGRLIPGYGGKIISVMAGMERVEIKLYLWTTMVTNFFGSVLLASGGYHLIRFLKL